MVIIHCLSLLYFLLLFHIVDCSAKCDFEVDFCTWENVKAEDEFDWIRRSGNTPTKGTGPRNDFVTKQYGTYIYTESSRPRAAGDRAKLKSKLQTSLNGNTCFGFYYYMFGKDMGSLSVYVVTETNERYNLWKLEDEQGDQWFHAQLVIPVQINTKYNIYVDAVRGKDVLSDIAIDNLELTEGIKCTTEPQYAALDYAIRLVGGAGPYAGRLEILYNGRWGTVCDDGWDENSARVVCRELGFDVSGKSDIKPKSLPEAAYGEGSGKILLDEFRCNGSEISYLYCAHSDFGVHNCKHNEDVSVICEEKDVKISINPASAGPFYEGEDATVISCSNDCSPPCENVWYESSNPSEILSYIDVLEIFSIQRYQAGNFTCRVARTTQDIEIDVIFGPDKAEISPSNISSVVQNGNLDQDVLCTADCWPACTAEWYRGAITQENILPSIDGTLKLTNLVKSDAGVYICKVTNTKNFRKSQAQGNFTLDIIYGPDVVVINPPVVDPVIEGKGEVPVVCTADCFPPCHIMWYKDDILVNSNEGVIDLMAVSERGGGVYVCLATNKQTNATSRKSIKIPVMYGPNNITFNIGPLQVGQVFPPIACESQCDPGCDVEWYKDNTKLNAVGGVMRFAQITKHHAGTYYCIAGNKYDSKHVYQKAYVQRVNVFVAYGPDFVTFTPPVVHPIKEGEAMYRIICSADCFPLCKVNWYRGPAVQTNVIPSAVTGVLQLTNITRKHAGNYTCTIFNPETKKILTRTASIYVYYGPGTVSIKPRPTMTTYIEGDNLPPISCSSDCSPCNITWYKNVVSPLSAVSTRNGVLNLTNITGNQAGKYICQVKNGITNKLLQENLAINVVYGPTELTLTPGDLQAVTVGGNIVPVKCSTQCNPACQIKWYRGTVSVTNLIPTINGVLDLRRVLVPQGGVYICMALNVHNNKMQLKFFNLLVQ